MRARTPRWPLPPSPPHPPVHSPVVLALLLSLLRDAGAIWAAPVGGLPHHLLRHLHLPRYPLLWGAQAGDGVCGPGTCGVGKADPQLHSRAPPLPCTLPKHNREFERQHSPLVYMRQAVPRALQLPHCTCLWSLHNPPLTPPPAPLPPMRQVVPRALQHPHYVYLSTCSP